MPTVIANRYARALADVVAPAGNYRQVLGELEDFGAAYRESLELREVCETPAVIDGAEVERAGSAGRQEWAART